MAFVYRASIVRFVGNRPNVFKNRLEDDVLLVEYDIIFSIQSVTVVWRRVNIVEKSV